MARSSAQRSGAARFSIWVLVLALTAVATALRWPGFEWWLNADEATYYQIATASPAAARRMIAENAHPPLYYHLLRLLAPFDSRFVLLRAPSMVAGVLLVPATYLLGRRWGGPVAGVAAAALVALSPGGINLAALMRPYSLQVLLIAAGVHALVVYEQDGRRGALVAYAACLAGALLVHYGTMVALAGIGLALLALLAARKLSRRQAIELGLVHLALGAIVAYLYFTHIAPSLMGGTLQSLAREGWLREELSSELSKLPRRLMDALHYTLGPRLGSYAGPLAALGLVVLAFEKRWLGVFLPLAVLMVALALAAREMYPLGLTRHCFYLLPFFACPAGAAVAWLARGRARWLLAAGLVLFVATDHGQSSRQAGTLTSVLPEHFIARSDVEATAAFLRREELSDAVLLTDQQTVEILRTLPGSLQADPPSAWKADLRFEQVGEWTFAISFHWRLLWIRESRAEPEHLEHFLDLVERAPGWSERLEADPVWFFQGGWVENPVGTSSARAPAVFSEFVGGPGLGAARLDVGRFRSYLAGRE